MKLYSILYLIGAYISFFIGIFVLSRNRKSNINFSFWLFTLATYIWLTSFAIAYQYIDEHLINLWFKIGDTGVVFIVIIAYHFTSTFLRKDVSEKKTIVGSYIIGFLFVILLWTTNLFYNGVYRYAWGYYPKASFLHPLYLLFLTILVLRFLFLIYYSMKKQKVSGASALEYKRTIYIFWSSIIFTCTASDFIQKYGVNLPPFGFVFVILYCLVVAYAIIRHRLMEIEVIIRRAVVFAGLFGTVFAVFAGLTIYGQRLITQAFGVTNQWLMASVAVLIITIIYYPLRNYLTDITDRFLFQKKYDYQKILREASVGMAQITDLRKLLSLIVHVVSSKLRSSQTSILLLDEDTNSYKLELSRGKDKIDRTIKLEQNNPLIVWLLEKKEIITLDGIDYDLENKRLLLRNPGLKDILEGVKSQIRELKASLCVPAFVKEKLIGVLILGEKLSRDLYSQTDFTLLLTLANQAALVIENAEFYEDVKETQVQLLQAEKMATIGTMADGLSHQMNNRLNALGIIAADTLDTMKMTDLKKCPKEVNDLLEQIKHSFERIEINVQQGGEIVRGLLKYSRTGAEGLEAVSLDSIINAAIEMAQYKVKLELFDLIRNYPKDGLRMLGNPTQLQEVFFNLIDNAYDAIMERKDTLKEPAYRGKIEISAQEEDGFLKIIIQDNGMGIARENQRRLFTPFFTTKVSSRKGTGLGLYVIHRIITQNHKGRISLSSVHKEGTRFEVELPLAK